MQKRVYMIVIAVMLSVSISQAQSSTSLRFVQWTIGDMTAIPQSVLTVQTGLTIGAVAGGLLAVSHFDKDLSQHAQEFAHSTPRGLRRVFHEMGNERIIRPMAGILFLGSLTGGNTYFQDAAFTSFQSIVFATLLTNGMKLIVGRSRPNTGSNPNSIHPFSGHRSFPSGHSTTVFALTTPWLMYYPSIATASIFVLGAGTAVARMADDYHWFSDVLAGAVIGFGTGYLLSKRHQGLARKMNLSFSSHHICLTWLM
ncbi:MAG: phosphatase PAP2 family protein [Bacteroidetes bacterium]|nr:phosphatase PAP2 family protein [Bacteroidota bacterium]